MTRFERDILKRVLDSSDKTRRIDINSILSVSEAKTLTANFQKHPEQYRDKISIPLRSLKKDVDRFWDRYINGGEM